MEIPEWVKPAAWGVVGGAIAAIIIGFSWGGWVTGGTAGEMVVESTEEATEAAIIRTMTPLCVAKAEQQPEQLVLLREESGWKRDKFVIEAGWVNSVSETYRSAVAQQCATIAVKGMQTD